jgi:hypothetical protein
MYHIASRKKNAPTVKLVGACSVKEVTSNSNDGDFRLAVGFPITSYEKLFESLLTIEDATLQRNVSLYAGTKTGKSSPHPAESKPIKKTVVTNPFKDQQRTSKEKNGGHQQPASFSGNEEEKPGHHEAQPSSQVPVTRVSTRQERVLIDLRLAKRHDLALERLPLTQRRVRRVILWNTEFFSLHLHNSSLE